MKDKERIKNTKIRIIKWERIWNNNREDKKERDRENNEWYMLQLRVEPLKRVELLLLQSCGELAPLKRTHDYSMSFIISF